MADFPLVSIITVTRNLIESGRRDYFRQCVESVRMQDYPNIEHLIIDGASTDETVNLLKEMKVNYISEPDSGIHNASNKGIRLAKGKYVAFLCSDDFYTRKDALSMAVQALELNNGDFTYAPVITLDENGIQTILNHRWEVVLNMTPFCTESMFASRKMLLELNGFDERYVVFSDYDLMIRAIQSGYLPIKMDLPFVVFRTNGISSNPDPKIKLERLNVIKERFGLSDKQAQRAFLHGFIPFQKLKEFLNKNTTFPNPEELRVRNRKCVFKYIRKWIFDLRTRKGKRRLCLFGINLYDEEKSSKSGLS